jgi:hypothetical protein
VSDAEDSEKFPAQKFSPQNPTSAPRKQIAVVASVIQRRTKKIQLKEQIKVKKLTGNTSPAETIPTIQAIAVVPR